MIGRPDKAISVCRICKSKNLRLLGSVKYYSDFESDIYDCLNCESRFTKCENVYEFLHECDKSGYALQAEIADRVKNLFDIGDIDGIRSDLCNNSRYDYILDYLDSTPSGSKIIEWGCSRGYLTSVSIAAGRDVVGVDASKTAVQAAVKLFGPHFVGIDDKAIGERAPYDLIYHVGTIGCVDDPVKMTEDLLGLLRPGGKLVFNVPNVEACWMRGQLWIDFAPPPDVISLFRPGFWVKNFSSLANVVEDVRYCSKEDSFRIWLSSLFHRWKPNYGFTLRNGLSLYKGEFDRNTSLTSRFWNWIEFSCFRVGLRLKLSELVRLRPTPYDFYVVMTRI